MEGLGWQATRRRWWPPTSSATAATHVREGGVRQQRTCVDLTIYYIKSVPSPSKYRFRVFLLCRTSATLWRFFGSQYFISDDEKKKRNLQSMHLNVLRCFITAIWLFAHRQTNLVFSYCFPIYLPFRVKYSIKFLKKNEFLFVEIQINGERK